MTVTETFPPQFMRTVPPPEIPDALLSAFESIPESPAASAVRSAAWKTFSGLGLPRTNDEEYSFTSISEIKSLFSRVPNTDSKTGFEVAKVKGVENISESVWVKTVATENDVASALAIALAPQYTALRLIAGTKLEQTSDITYRNNELRTDAALFFEMEKDSAAKIDLRSTSSTSDGFFNGSLVFHLGENAELDFAEMPPVEGAQMLKLHFIMERGAKLRFLSASTGSRFQRLAIEVDLLDSNTEVDLRGAAVVGGTNRCHRHVLVHHHAPDCVSRQLFKAVVLGSGRSSVDGTVIVDRGAQHTDAKQLLRHLMLSKDAKADSKPRLYIHADDVKCSHGATVGKMDANQLFYLRSRGLDMDSANSLLTHAFLGEALDASALTDFREAARSRLLAALERKS